VLLRKSQRRVFSHLNIHRAFFTLFTFFEAFAWPLGKMKFSPVLVSVYAALQFSFASGLTISEINGHKYLSPYAGQNVTAVKGLITAKGPRLVFLFWVFSIYGFKSMICVQAFESLEKVTDKELRVVASGSNLQHWIWILDHQIQFMYSVVQLAEISPWEISLPWTQP
jgi:hypothetical protein